MASFDYDVVIIGSGFGGSVSALRAAEKSYRVAVMESGPRWPDEKIPKTQWDLAHFIWFPALELYGIQRIEYLDVDRAIQKVAKDIGRDETHNKAPLGVYFGTPGVEADDPYFGGVGMDGSVMPANPGVNPSLSITALAERAMSLWPNKGEADTRPPLGSGYERVAAVMPHRPFVPAGAPGELRLDATKEDVIPAYPY